MCPEADMEVEQRPDGKWEVREAGEVLVVCASNEDAWRWIDRHRPDGFDDRHDRVRMYFTAKQSR